MPGKKRVIISVSDKTLLPELAERLVQMNWEIISTGGTAKALTKAKIPVTPVEKVTRFPEGMDGRIKTLHPAIFGGILADRNVPEHLEFITRRRIKPIHLVVCNLYPFKKTVESGAPYKTVIENIDVGGPSMIRAAAKNHESVPVIVDPADYELLLGELRKGEISPDMLRTFAAKVFRHTAEYDMAIAEYLDAHPHGE